MDDKFNITLQVKSTHTHTRAIDTLPLYLDQRFMVLGLV